MSLLSNPVFYLEFTRNCYSRKLKVLGTVQLKEILARIGGPTEEHDQDQDLVDRILDRVVEETKVGIHEIKKIIEEFHRMCPNNKEIQQRQVLPAVVPIVPEKKNVVVEPTQQEQIRGQPAKNLQRQVLPGKSDAVAGPTRQPQMLPARIVQRQAVLPAVPEKSSVVVEPTQQEKIQCICGKSASSGEMIRCQDQTCGVLQHRTCVVNNTPGKLPGKFYCELCRLSRADPFCLTLPKIPLLPVKLPRPVKTDYMAKTFFLTAAESEGILKRKEYEVQAWCMLLDDEVPFRIQWPKQASLRVNGREMQPSKRPGGNPLSANGRDDGADISQFIKAGANTVYVTTGDSRMFCFGVRLVKRRTVEQVMDLIPGESQGEKLDDAVARVRRCVGGGHGGDGDDDVEVVSDCVPVNLRCPMSGSRIKVAGRFKPCVHMGCFDLEVFLEMSMRSKKWQCPVCLKNYCLNDVIIDPYFNRVATRLRNLGHEDVNDVEVKADGSWRAKMPDNNRGLWHAPDGSYILDLNMADDGTDEKPEVLEAVSVNAKDDHEFGDAEVIALSDSEDEDDTVGAGQQEGLARASLKRARETTFCPFSVPKNKRLCSTKLPAVFEH